MSTVDHRALMLDALDAARLAANFDVGSHFTAIAQVHATALVAEQARIANLMTVLSDAVLAHGMSGADLRAQIREGLGL